MVNYDALSFLELLAEDSVRIVDISMVLADSPELFREVLRVLEPGGMCVTYDFNGMIPPLKPWEENAYPPEGIRDDLVNSGFHILDEGRLNRRDMRSDFVKRHTYAGNRLQKYLAVKPMK